MEVGKAGREEGSGRRTRESSCPPAHEIPQSQTELLTLDTETNIFSPQSQNHAGISSRSRSSISSAMIQKRKQKPLLQLQHFATRITGTCWRFFHS